MKNQAYAQGLWTAQGTEKKEILGMLRIEPDGRRFRYAKAGEALATGKMSYMATGVANHINVAVAVNAAIGDLEVQVTVGATLVTENQYEDGALHVNDETGEGHSYAIESNTACDASGTTTLKLKEPIVVALVAGTSEVSLIANPWSSITQSTTEESGSAGVPLKAITSAYYFWIQTGGQAICLGSDSSAVGTLLSHDATEGAVAVQADYTKGLVGFVWNTAQVSGEYKPIFLTID